MNKKYAVFAIAAVVAVTGILYFGTGLNQQASVAASTSGSPANPIEDPTLPTPIMTAFQWTMLCRDGKPHLQVLSPNGGESYKVGDSITVKWRSCNAQTGDKANFYIQSSTGELVGPSLLGSTSVQSTSYNIVIPHNMIRIVGGSEFVPGDYYKIRVDHVTPTFPVTGPVAIDNSDRTFTVNNPSSFPKLTFLNAQSGIDNIATGGTFVYRFQVEAVGSDYYIPKKDFCSQYLGGVINNKLLTYKYNTSGTLTDLGCIVSTPLPGPEIVNDFYKIEKGQTEAFDLVVNVKRATGPVGTVNLEVLRIPVFSTPSTSSTPVVVLPFNPFKLFLNI